MSIYYCKKTRRQFLAGAGKSLLALPLLPSLMPAEIFAQTVQAQRRMMLFWFDHENLTTIWPSRSIASQSVGSDGARQVSLSTMARSAMGPAFNNTRFESLKNSGLITMLRGLDTAVGYGPGHGNFTLACGQGRNSEGDHPTIDTIIERSATVYPSSTPVSVRKAVRINNMGGSAFYDKVGARVQALPNYSSNINTFYNEIFAGLTGGSVPPVDTTNQLKSNILNRVHESFTSFRNNRRVSADDRARLDQHMGYISDLQRSFASMQPPPSQTQSCVRPSSPGNIESNPEAYHRMYMQLMAIAFKCGLTKFGVMALDAHDPRWIPGFNITGGFHEAIHGDAGHDAQLRAFNLWWTYYPNLIADHFLANLQDLEGNTGRSYLENMVTGMICVGGMHGPGGGGHSGLDSQQILIGNMGGAMRSGNYVALPESGGRRLPYNCFLLTLLQLMGVPQSEYAYATPDGRGIGYYAGFGSNHPYRHRNYGPITEILT